MSTCYGRPVNCCLCQASACADIPILDWNQQDHNLQATQNSRFWKEATAAGWTSKTGLPKDSLFVGPDFGPNRPGARCAKCLKPGQACQRYYP